MHTLQILKEEHQNILRLTRIMRNMSMALFHGAEPATEDIRKVGIIIHDYADALHHTKEENILFNAVLEHTDGDLATSMIRHGMLIEHDQARFIVLNLETANNRYAITPTEALRLDILVYLREYAELLERHVDKENNVAYPFSERALPAAISAAIDQEMIRAIETPEQQTLRDASLALLDELECTYENRNGGLRF